jgi:LPS export ABC transporter protein LptC
MKRALALPLALALAAACKQGAQTDLVKTGSAADTAEQIMYGVRAPVTESGVKRGILKADSMYVFNNQNRFDFYHGNVEFNNADGFKSGTMKGDRGRYDIPAQKLEGWGNVEVRMADGGVLRSSHLIYDQRTDKITTEAAYTLVKNGQTLSGVGLDTDAHFKTYRCQASCSASGAMSIPK